MTTVKKALYIGGHGKIGLLSAPLISEKGYEIHSLIRNPDQAPEIEKLGATPVIKDITELSVDEWAELLTLYDVVVWGAGNGGRGGAELTTAVDRDGALATIDALEQLKAAGKPTPKYVMISYVGATHNTADRDETSWYAYVEAKKAVDNRLNASQLDYLILGPSALSDEPAEGIEVLESPSTEKETSRELVAQVVAEVVGRDEFPNTPLEFYNGTNPVSSI